MPEPTIILTLDLTFLLLKLIQLLLILLPIPLNMSLLPYLSQDMTPPSNALKSKIPKIALTPLPTSLPALLPHPLLILPLLPPIAPIWASWLNSLIAEWLKFNSSQKWFSRALITSTLTLHSLFFLTFFLSCFLPRQSSKGDGTRLENGGNF